MVMNLGRAVVKATVPDLDACPRHPCTAPLRVALPIPDLARVGLALSATTDA